MPLTNKEEIPAQSYFGASASLSPQVTTEPAAAVLGGAAHAVGDVTGINNAVNCIENPSRGQCLEAAGKLLLTASAIATDGGTLELEGGLEAATEGALSGSGPASGILEVSSQVKSTAAFGNFNPAVARDFVFDPVSERLLVGGKTCRRFSAIRAWSGWAASARILL